MSSVCKTVGSRRGAVAGVALAMMVAAGCRQVEESRNPISDSLTDIGATVAPEERSRSRELSRVQFDDIPVPRGLFLRNHRNESYSYRFGRARIGRFVYWGRGSEEELAARYLELMPKDPYNWRLAPAGSQESTAMVFEKPGQRCEIRLARQPHAPEGGILVTISVEST